MYYPYREVALSMQDLIKTLKIRYDTVEVSLLKSGHARIMFTKPALLIDDIKLLAKIDREYTCYIQCSGCGDSLGDWIIVTIYFWENIQFNTPMEFGLELVTSEVG